MGKFKDTNITFSIEFSPLENIKHNLSEKLGDFNAELLNFFYSRSISKKVNIIISELFNNIIENTADKSSKAVLDINVKEQNIQIKVKNKVTQDQYKKVKEHIDLINSNSNPSKFLYETIKLRRQHNLKGGLGLIRLVSEEKANLDTQYNNSYLTIIANLSIKGKK
jgi:hypothetical protein